MSDQLRATSIVSRSWIHTSSCWAARMKAISESWKWGIIRLASLKSLKQILKPIATPTHLPNQAFGLRTNHVAADRMTRAVTIAGSIHVSLRLRLRPKIGGNYESQKKYEKVFGNFFSLIQDLNLCHFHASFFKSLFASPALMLIHCPTFQNVFECYLPNFKPILKSPFCNIKVQQINQNTFHWQKINDLSYLKVLENRW